jgi:hypothetical protein
LLGDAESSLDDAESSLDDAESHMSFVPQDDPATARGSLAFRQKGGYNYVGPAAADAAQVPIQSSDVKWRIERFRVWHNAKIFASYVCM